MVFKITKLKITSERFSSWFDFLIGVSERRSNIEEFMIFSFDFSSNGGGIASKFGWEERGEDEGINMNFFCI